MEKQMIPVIVTLSGYTHGEREEGIRLMCRGKMRPTADGCMLRYEEIQEDDNGTTVSQDVILNIQQTPQPRVTMSRLGDFGTTMVFVKEQRFEGAYRTPYGDLALALYAMQVQVRLTQDSGHIHLEYQLDVQGGFPTVQGIDVSFCAEGGQPC